jgi:hypothetical protein
MFCRGNLFEGDNWEEDKDGKTELETGSNDERWMELARNHIC